MNKRHFRTFLLLLAFCLLNAHEVFAVSGNRDMKNITMVPYADHMFLFYRCGDDLYFNHDIKKLRQENGSSVTFNWYQNQTLIGLMYCDGFGFPFAREKVASKDISVSILPEQLDVFYAQNVNPEVVKKTSYKKVPGDFPQTNDWSANETLKTKEGNAVLADSFQAFEFNGKSYLLYAYQGTLRLFTPDKKSLSFNLDRKSTRLNSSHLKLSRMPSSA